MRDEGTARQYIDVSFPAVPDFHLVSSLESAAKKLGFSYHTGIIHCKDSFYMEDREMVPDVRICEWWETLRNARVLSTSMESATLFVIASLRGVSAATVLAVIGDTYSGKPIIDDHIKRKTIENAVKTALEAVVILNDKDSQSQ